MDAVSLGPLVLAYDRLVVFVGLGLFLAGAELAARRLAAPRLSAGAWNAALVGVLVARLGYVVAHWNVYASDPLSVFWLWQGGFAPLWGLLGGTLYALWFYRRQPRLLRAALLPAALGLAVALGMWSLHGSAATGKTLPAVELRTLSGATVNLADFAGKPLLVNAWATWCPPCRRELPMLARAAREHPEATFVFVNLSEPPQRVKSYLQERGLDLENALIDSGGLARALPLVGYPTTYVFDAGGRLVASKTGELSRAALEDMLAKAR